MKNERSTPTMKDVAKEAIKKLNYQVNSYAQGLKASRTYTAAFLIPNTRAPFFALLTYHMNAALLKRRYRMLLCCTDYGLNQEQEYINVRAAFAAGKYDGKAAACLPSGFLCLWRNCFRKGKGGLWPL